MFDLSCYESIQPKNALKRLKFLNTRRRMMAHLHCAVIASGNTLSGLKYQVEGLAYDYRDVIVAVEYIRRKGDYVQVRDLSQPISADA